MGTLGLALGRKGFVQIRQLATPAPATNAPAADDTAFEAAMFGGRLVSTWRSLAAWLDRSWNGSTTRLRLRAVTDDFTTRPAVERVRLGGYVLAAALVTNAVITRLAVFAHPLPLAVWSLLALVTLAVIGRPGAMLAAWMDRIQ
jgi:hypothetical protein